MVQPRSLLFTTALAVALSSPFVVAGPVQKDGIAVPPNMAGNRDAVKQIFMDSYEAYKQDAWGHDDLAPLSKGFVDSRNGWGATIVDGMSTMSIMGLDNYLGDAIKFASQIDFSKSKTSDSVSVFETTIRYIGGLLSTYELSGRKHPELVDKAKEVADKLAIAWVGDNDIPFGHINFGNNAPDKQNSNIAEAGTLTLEWATLSKYTGDDKYRNLAEKAFRRIATNPSPLPGLPAQGIDPNTGSPVGGYVTWGGGSDSYFEYLIKYARLNNTGEALWADTWKLAVDSSIQTLLKKSTVGDHSYLTDYDSEKRNVYVSSHLACFHGGNWLLGGQLLRNQTVVDVALQLVDACWNTYASTATGIGPEAFAFASVDGNYTAGSAPTPEQQAFYELHGFYPTTGAEYYILRPEVLESNFYAWRVTGDAKYLDRAASAVSSFQKYLKAPVAYAGIQNVNDVNSGKFNDMESFWFAEVLKYLYLTFDDPSHISLDEWVFNTEAHPFQIPPAKGAYGTPSGQTPPSPSQQHPFTPTQAPIPAYSQSPTLPGILHIPEGIIRSVATGILNIIGFQL
ncbi:glycoside hydrolase family 47 protein [Macrolepiota fuliginosa MF-IS2]|uniref:alpha-1,2-Mannosidase n=1 Tax=Macrolepiota fuliginosa MF-IS2 TaxID=1400762 RepID=A0A9P5X705_9AGAR|nr:glycoside hydrolase family 47 protein [Macrolepiota fuliginosa MF-IS2]